VRRPIGGALTQVAIDARRQTQRLARGEYFVPGGQAQAPHMLAQIVAGACRIARPQQACERVARLPAFDGHAGDERSELAFEPARARRAAPAGPAEQIDAHPGV